MAKAGPDFPIADEAIDNDLQHHHVLRVRGFGLYNPDY
jgi:hypothetical protein